MRAVPAMLAARLVSGVTTLAYVWKVTRRDSQTFAFTDHDRPLTFEGMTAQPSTGLITGAIEKSLDLAVDTASVAGALNAAALSEDELSRGLWDGARVDLYRVDWTDVSLRVHVFAGHLGEVRRGVSAFEAELRGLQAALNTPVGRVFSCFCDADVGDARCTVNLETAVFKGAGAVTQVLSAASFRASGLGAFAAGWFTSGRLVWTSGGSAEISAHRIDAGEAVIDLLDPAGPALQVGASFTVTAGCDKRFETCRVKFANTTNFRGFPHMPGNDVVQAGPRDGERMDGSSRFA
ncbi:MAG: DUF2163 domain-containing protein [Hyphomonadaceae bacterium]|nr:DUF2163 domain-containing protein [Hyphomonadaceae bacterium]